MENAVHSLIDIFKLSSFRIPQYQRAYAWVADPHLNAFLSDLREQVNAQKSNSEKTYFLGTLLLHEISKETLHIVDGQQRLTTSVIFIAAALQRNKEKTIFSEKLKKILRNNYIFDEVEEVQKFQTIMEDNPFFRSHILKIHDSCTTEESPSSKRLKQAMDYFSNEVDDHEWKDLVNALINAKVMVYSVPSAADATLIFELQNDRGKKLTDLEALKSYLMHLIYLNAGSPDQDLEEIQTQFSEIYRQIERHSEDKNIPTEDAILSYHCAAYLDWKTAEWRHPKELVKATVKHLPKKDITDWVLCFVSNVRETYKTFTRLFQKLDDYPSLAELIILDRMATFWPLIIKTYNIDNTEDKSKFQLCCRLMEVYAMRGYGISNIRSDAGLSSIYSEAKDFTDGFEKLFTFLHSMSNWYDLNDRFENGLDNTSIYKSNRRDAQYLLWRYENYLRSQIGKKTGYLSWKQYLSPRDDASRLSIEHIAAQNNPISSTIVEWKDGEQKEFQEVVTHRLGNLVLDSKSANSSKGKYDFTDKLTSLSHDSQFLSQGELINWAEKDETGAYIWNMKSVKRRHEALKGFALNVWDPDNYYKPVSDTSIIHEHQIGEIES